MTCNAVISIEASALWRGLNVMLTLVVTDDDRRQIRIVGAVQHWSERGYAQRHQEQPRSSAQRPL